MRFPYQLLLLAPCFVLLVCFPSLSIAGATNGLQLWFNVIIPSLLPFLIMTKLIVSMNIIPKNSKVLYHIVVGLLCGYPVGAANIASGVKEKQISTQMGQFLLSFCNNPSPMFLTGYVVYSQLGVPSYYVLIPVYSSIAATALISILIYKPFKKEHTRIECTQSAGTHMSFFPALDKAIMDSLHTIAKVGGYMIIFSILTEFLLSVLPIGILSAGIIGALEMTIGVHCASSLYIPFYAKIVLINAIITFGGICITFQTISMISKSELSISKYIGGKLLNSYLSICTTLLFLLLYSFFLH